MSIISLAFQRRKKVGQFLSFWDVTTVLPNTLKNTAGQGGDGREKVTHICITYITTKLDQSPQHVKFTAHAQC